MEKSSEVKDAYLTEIDLLDQCMTVLDETNDERWPMRNKSVEASLGFR